MNKKAYIIIGIVISLLVVQAVAAGPVRDRGINVRLIDGEIDWDQSRVVVDGGIVDMKDLLDRVKGAIRWERPANMVGAALRSVTGWLPGEIIWLELPGIAVDGKVYLPMRLLAEAMGGKVSWDEDSQMIVIDYHPAPPMGTVDDLEYEIRRDGRELSLIVNNPTDRIVELEFPSGKTHDFTLVDGRGNVVWRDSDGKSYTLAVVRDRMEPGETRVYESRVPETIRPGVYIVRGFFPPVGQSQVAAARIEIAASRLPLTYELMYRPATGGFGADYDRMTFQIMNRTRDAITLRYPGAGAFKLVVTDNKGDVVWEYSGRRWTEGNTEIVPAGSSRFHAVRMPELPKGNYRAYAYFPPAGSEPVIRTVFNVK